MHALILPAVPSWSLLSLLILELATSWSISLAISLTLAVMHKHYNGFSLTLCGFGIDLSLYLSYNWLLISQEQRFLMCTVEHISLFFLPAHPLSFPNLFTDLLFLLFHCIKTSLEAETPISVSYFTTLLVGLCSLDNWSKVISGKGQPRKRGFHK